MRLSERFKTYYQLVATSGSRGDQSLAVLASDIYLDMDETSQLIARTRQEIARATLMEQLNQERGATFIFSTHDQMVMEYARRLIHIRDGRVAGDETK